MTRCALLLGLSLAVGPARADVILASSASSPGAFGSFWRTDVQVVNTSLESVTFQPVLSNHAEQGRQVVGPEISLPPQAQVTYVDALSTLLGAEAPAFGPIRFVSSSPLSVSAVVYTNNSCGRVGFSFEGVDPRAAARSGLMSRLDGGGSKRTNLILLNPSDSPATVRLRILPLPETAVVLQPGEWRQINDVVSFLGSGEARPLLVFSADQPILALATVIDNDSGQALAVTPSPFDPSYKLVGLSFSPYLDGQDPNAGTIVSEEQLTSRMTLVRPYATWIRTFGSTNGLERSGRVAKGLGLKTALGAWLGSDASANESEIENLITAGKAGEADLLIVGSEVLLRGDLSEAALLSAMERVRGEVPGVPVTTADTYGVLLAHPPVLRASDVVLANYYPYWEGVPVGLAVAALHEAHRQLLAASGGKAVWVSETGWPSAGNAVGGAVPSPENAAFYLLNFVSWARSVGATYFYFSALDESWKSQYEGPQGAHWGVFDKNGVLKPGMQPVFDGATVWDNWSSGTVPGGPVAAAIELSHVPAQPRRRF